MVHCNICKKNKEKLDNYHISYYPEKIQKLCRSCHMKTIHNKKHIRKPKWFNSKLIKQMPVIKVSEATWKKLYMIKAKTGQKIYEIIERRLK